jgi:hypothetical protein
MVRERGLEIFNIVHPDLPFLVGLILSFLADKRDLGSDILSMFYSHNNIYRNLNTYFGPKTRVNSLIYVLRRKRTIVKRAKKELGLDPKHPYSNTLLIDSLERIPIVCQSNQHHNLLWQLKAVVLICEFLGLDNLESLQRKHTPHQFIQ